MYLALYTCMSVRILLSPMRGIDGVAVVDQRHHHSAVCLSQCCRTRDTYDTALEAHAHICYSLVTRRHAAVCTRDTCLIPLGLDALPVVVEVFQQRVIALIEDLAAMRGNESHACRQRQRHIRYSIPLSARLYRNLLDSISMQL